MEQYQHPGRHEKLVQGPEMTVIFGSPHHTMEGLDASGFGIIQKKMYMYCSSRALCKAPDIFLSYFVCDVKIGRLFDGPWSQRRC